MNAISWKPLLLLLVVALTGCDSGRRLYQVTGTVTQKGQPVEGAQVTFAYGNHDFASGSTDAAGRYRLSFKGSMGAPVGKCKVSVIKVAVVNFDASAMGMPNSPEGWKLKQETMGPKMMEFGEQASKAKSLISTDYADPDKTGLAFEVTRNEEENVYDIKLK